MSDAVKAFDAAAPGYDSWYASASGRRVFEAERAALERFLPEEGVGLEAGAGTGIFSEALTEGRRSVVCLDLSREMLSLARRRGLPSVLGDASAPPFRSCLDFAFMVTVLEFLPDPVGALRAIGGSLRAGAPLVTLFVNRESPWGRLYSELGSRGDPVFRHARLYTLGEYEGLLAEAGLSPLGAVGTLTGQPGDPDAGSDLVDSATNPGVICAAAHRRE